MSTNNVPVTKYCFLLTYIDSRQNSKDESEEASVTSPQASGEKTPRSAGTGSSDSSEDEQGGTISECKILQCLK